VYGVLGQRVLSGLCFVRLQEAQFLTQDDLQNDVDIDMGLFAGPSITDDGARFPGLLRYKPNVPLQTADIMGTQQGFHSINIA